jgi:hypothetical protein
MVSWLPSKFTCGDGPNQPRATSVSVEPNVVSPHAFSRGDHIIKYTFKLESGQTVVCPVKIVVRGKEFEFSFHTNCKKLVRDVAISI